LIKEHRHHQHHQQPKLNDEEKMRLECL
jgi:hypothetical protein